MGHSSLKSTLSLVSGNWVYAHWGRHIRMVSLRHVVVSVDEYMCAFSSSAHSGHEPGSLSSEGRLNLSKHSTTSPSASTSLDMNMGKGNDSNMVPRPAGFQGSSL